MGRIKYTEQERIQMIATFLKATQQIINEEGIEQISIRKVAKLAGFNSATIYLYFQDVDELITIASMGYLQDYCIELEEHTPVLSDAYDTYLYTWQLFCRYAFAHPHIYYHLFFHSHSRPLNETVEKYYQLFPEVLKDCSPAISAMLHAGRLETRNYQVLHPLVQQGRIPQESVELINDLTICYFRKLLEEACDDHALDQHRQVERMVEAVVYLLKK